MRQACSRAAASVGRSSPRRMIRGVTMIEILVAMAILSLMMTAVWQGFKGTSKGIEIADKQHMRERQIRNAMLRITSELSMAYLSFNRPRSELRHFTYFEGRRSSDGDTLTFSAFAHIRVRKDANESDQSVIQYFVAEDPDDPRRKHLFRRESRRLTGDLPDYLEQFFPAYVFLEDVESITFRYWDYRRMDWIDEWATVRTDGQPDRIPERVKIELIIRDEEGEKIRYHSQVVLPMQEKLDFSR